MLSMKPMKKLILIILLLLSIPLAVARGGGGGHGSGHAGGESHSEGESSYPSSEEETPSGGHINLYLGTQHQPGCESQASAAQCDNDDADSLPLWGWIACGAIFLFIFGIVFLLFYWA